jgi:general secretion pathway protein L
MADWLLIRLAREPERDATWTVVDDAGRIVVAPQSGALREAVSLAAGRRVCALLPGADVLVTEAEVPLRGGAKLQQVVPFALEEQLAEDIEELHFALGKRAAGSSRVPVAVVSRALLDRWLGELKAAGLAAEAVHADSELVPANPGQIVALLEGDEIVLRMPDGAPVTIPTDTFSSALAVAAEGSGDAPARALLVYASPADWERYAPDVERLREHFEGIKVQLLASGAIALFAQRLHAANAINLLQGEYAPVSSMKEGWRAWRLAAILAGCLLALHVAGKTLELGVLQRAESRADASMEETFRQAMPGEQNTVDAKRRMQQRLAAARGGGTSGLLPALAALAQARAAVPGTSLSSLSYREGTLDLRMTAPNAESLDRLSQMLRSQGWQADLTSGSASEGGYQGQLQLRAGGAS